MTWFTVRDSHCTSRRRELFNMLRHLVHSEIFDILMDVHSGYFLFIVLAAWSSLMKKSCDNNVIRWYNGTILNFIGASGYEHGSALSGVTWSSMWGLDASVRCVQTKATAINVSCISCTSWYPRTILESGTTRAGAPPDKRVFRNWRRASYTWNHLTYSNHFIGANEPGLTNTVPLTSQ